MVILTTIIKANAHGAVGEFTQEMNNEYQAAFSANLIDRIVSATDAKIILTPAWVPAPRRF